ncbi:hypothetical protein [Halosegnis sp.]
MFDSGNPSWETAVSTVASYGLILGVMTLLLFAVPFALFLFFG